MHHRPAARFPGSHMSPNKFFDYLDGKLPVQEREELEARLANDSTLLRQLAIARRLREGMPDSHEVIGSLEENAETKRGAILSRRVALAFIVLVFLNVFIGLWFIFQRQKPSAKNRDTDLRRQVEQSLEKAAASALPTPNIEADEIKIVAAPEQRELIANKVIKVAADSGGAGSKALSDENGIVILIDLPKNREADFRQGLVALGAPSPGPMAQQSSQPNERKFLQVRVVSAAPAAKQ
jgi:hypothetical protein